MSRFCPKIAKLFKSTLEKCIYVKFPRFFFVEKEKKKFPKKKKTASYLFYCYSFMIFS